MKSSNWKISTRLAVGFGALFLVMALSVAESFIGARIAQSRLQAAITSSQDKLDLAQAMRASLLEAGTSVRNVGLIFDVNLMNKERDQFTAHLKAYHAAEAALGKLDLDAAEQAALERARAFSGQAEPFIQEAFNLAQSFNPDEAGKVLTQKLAPVQQKWVAEFDALVRLQRSKQQATLADAATAVDRRNLIVGGIYLLVIGAGIAFATWLTRSITRPLQEAVAYAQRVAAGDLSVIARAPGKDEAAAVLNALGAMTQQLAQLVRSVRESVESISTASQEIAGGNHDLSARTEGQAAALEQTSASMQQLTEAVRQNAAHAGSADQLAQQAYRVADESGSVMQQVEHTMTEINQSSQRIVDIIGTIDGIAFQTNILALNAAVEAARAGEQGRGFAVVASEVRALAQRSAGAAREIKALITTSVENVERGGRLVGDAGQTMRGMLQSVDSVKQIITEIAAASTHQREGIEQVNSAVSQMDQGTQQNAALVEEAAAAAASLQQQAQHLSGLVAVFRLA